MAISVTSLVEKYFAVINNMMESLRILAMNTFIWDVFPPPSKVDSGVERVAESVNQEFADSGGKIKKYASP